MNLIRKKESTLIASDQLLNSNEDRPIVITIPYLSIGVTNYINTSQFSQEKYLQQVMDISVTRTITIIKAIIYDT
jgi:hypothetical protein